MKSTIWKLFVTLAIVMSFIAVQAVWAGTGPGGPIPTCSETVKGTVTMVYGDAIEVDGIIIYGIPDWLDIESGDQVVVTCFVSPEDNYVACDVTINDEDEELRRRGQK